MDDSKWYRRLTRDLQRHVDACAASIDDMPPAGTYDGEQAQRRQVAAAWVALSAVVAWAEDHDLVHVRLRRGLRSDGRLHTDAGNPVGALVTAFADLCVHPATQWLLHPRWSRLRDGTPSTRSVQDLADWWAGDAPSLAWQAGDGPESITGWVVGDLLQALSSDRRADNALVQTPWWVADGILDETLVPAAAERPGQPLQVIDPTCGTGHFLIRVYDYLWQWYRSGHLPRRQMRRPAADGGPMWDPGEALAAIAAGVHGVELDPLAGAIARLRCTVMLGHYAHQSGLLPRLRLDTIPHRLAPVVAVGDSLLLGKATRQQYAELHPQLADLPGAAWPHDDLPWADDEIQPDLFASAGGDHRG